MSVGQVGIWKKEERWQIWTTTKSAKRTQCTAKCSQSKKMTLNDAMLADYFRSNADDRLADHS